MMSIPSSLTRDISPPARRSKRQKTSNAARVKDDATAPSSLAVDVQPTLAAVEAGRARIEDHVAYFRDRLSNVQKKFDEGQPKISMDEWTNLYTSNEHKHGNHFVVHQHNHPISGVHYDLRLQFSVTSSLSFALPKGLPGNPNSRSLGRMVIETRVHNLWNHLIESASSRTGSLLIWDTGTYTILPRKNPHKHPLSPETTDNESSDVEAITSTINNQHQFLENEKLIEAFKTRYIRLRLNGVRLPQNYTVTLRLPSANDFGKQTSRLDARKRRRRRSKPTRPQKAQFTDSEPEAEIQTQQQQPPPEDIDTDEDEDARTWLNNAYPGSTNSIGSIHQRQWFMLLDRASSGFFQDKTSGKCNLKAAAGEGFVPFFVRGRDYERSIVTGRLAREVESDEGVEGFVGRRGWTGIMH